MRLDGVHFFLNTSTLPLDIKYEIWKHMYPNTLLTCCICNTILLEETHNEKLMCKKKYTCIDSSYKCMDCISVKSSKCVVNTHCFSTYFFNIALILFGMVYTENNALILFGMVTKNIALIITGIVFLKYIGYRYYTGHVFV